MNTTRSKALRSPAEKKPLSQMYLIIDVFFSVTHTNIPQYRGYYTVSPLFLQFSVPCWAILHAFFPLISSPQ